MACLVWNQRQETWWQPQGQLQRQRLGQGLTGQMEGSSLQALDL